MKKYLLFLLTCIVLSSANYAQIGIRVGAFGQPQGCWVYNQNWLDADNNYAPTPIYRTNFGLDLGYNFKDQLGIRANIIYNQMGVRNEDKEGGVTSSNLNVGGNFPNTIAYDNSYQGASNDKVIKTDIIPKYISTPLMLRVNSNPLSNVISHFDLVFTPSFLVGMGSRYKEGGAAWKKSPDSVNTKLKKYTNSFDFAIGIGVGVDVKLAENLYLNLSVLRINYSLTDAFKSQDKTGPFVWYRDNNDNATQNINLATGGPTNATPDSRKYHHLTISSQVGIAYIITQN
ncbi:MAG: outer membrane beta-barrel protein [Bacteroidia bacterium]|nr:outer membrane beta-barrel protein [Bacteroidia bacterium]